jgi:hypothetical protein
LAMKGPSRGGKARRSPRVGKNRANRLHNRRQFIRQGRIVRAWRRRGGSRTRRRLGRTCRLPGLRRSRRLSRSRRSRGLSRSGGTGRLSGLCGNRSAGPRRTGRRNPRPGRGLHGTARGRSGRTGGSGRPSRRRWRAGNGRTLGSTGRGRRPLSGRHGGASTGGGGWSRRSGRLSGSAGRPPLHCGTWTGLWRPSTAGRRRGTGCGGRRGGRRGRWRRCGGRRRGRGSCRGRREVDLLGLAEGVGPAVELVLGVFG